MADEVEGVEVLADFLGQRLEQTGLRSASSSMIACLRSAAVPPVRKCVEAGEALPQRLAVKSRRLSVTSLPFSSRYSTRSAMIVA